MSISCSICHEDIHFSDEEISVLICGHLFHKRCLQQWLDADSTCPECRSKVTRNNFVMKVYPSVNENSDLVYKGSFDETKTVLKIYEDSTKNLQEMFIKRIVYLENQNLALTTDLQKSLDEKDLLSQENLRLKSDNEELISKENEVKSLKEENKRFENNVDKLMNENELLKKECSTHKSALKSLKEFKSENRKLKKKLSSMMSLLQEATSKNESTLSEEPKSTLSRPVPAVSPYQTQPFQPNVTNSPRVATKLVTAASSNKSVEKSDKKLPSLERADDAYRIKKKEERSEVEEVQRRIRSILNKLTPQKFTELMEQALEIDLCSNEKMVACIDLIFEKKFTELMEQALEIDLGSYEKMVACIDLIFEKALDEPVFSEAYANMCSYISNPPRVKGKPRKTNISSEFRKNILIRCQHQFEKDVNKMKLHEKLKEVDIEMNKEENEEKKKEIKVKRETMMQTFRKRMTGNIKFIGELFKKRMLNGNVMTICINQLFDAGTDEHYETMIKLIKMVGQQMEQLRRQEKIAENRKFFDDMFNKFKRGLDKKIFKSSRIKFAFMDLIDLRNKHNWVEKNKSKQSGPKMIADVINFIKDHEEEERKKQMNAQSFNKKNTSREYESRDPRNYGPGGMPGGGRH